MSGGSGCGGGKCTTPCCFCLPRQHLSSSLLEGEERDDKNNNNAMVEDQSEMLWVMSTGQQQVAGSRRSNQTSSPSDGPSNATNPKVAEPRRVGGGGWRGEW